MKEPSTLASGDQLEDGSSCHHGKANQLAPELAGQLASQFLDVGSDRVDRDLGVRHLAGSAPGLDDKVCSCENLQPDADSAECVGVHALEFTERVQHEHPRAFEAATKVDPMLLANALDHIANTAARSRTSTRRLRWIEQRALIALRGEEYRDIDLDLPKSAGPDTSEKLQRRMAYHIAVKHAHAEALRQLVDVCERMDLEHEAERPSEEEYQQALAGARAVLDDERNGAPTP